MALTTVPSATVKSALSAAVDQWSLLIGHASINKWSKYKPVRGNYPAGNGYYGFNLPSNWNYNQPRGGVTYSEPMRAGDFRGYEHDQSLTVPPVWLQNTNVDLETTFTPSIPAGTFGKWTFRNNTGSSSVKIMPSDLGIENYYWGIKIQRVSGGAIYYKTSTYVMTHASYADPNFAEISMSVTLDDPSVPSFQNFPYIIDDTVRWTAIICSTQKLSWTTDAPSNIIELPTGIVGSITMVNTGTFDIDNWADISDDSHSWLSPEYGLSVAKSSVIYVNGSEVWGVTDNLTHAFPSWLTYKVYDEDDLNDITGSPLTWTNGCILKLYPTTYNNSGSDLTGDVYININGSDLAVIAALHHEQETITVNLNPTLPLLLSHSSASNIVGTNDISVSFRPYNGDEDPDFTISYLIKYDGVTKGSGYITGCLNGVQKTVSLTATEDTTDPGQTVTVDLTL